MSLATAELSTRGFSRRPLPPIHRLHKPKIERLAFKPPVIRYLLHCARFMNNQGRWCTAHDTAGKAIGRSSRQCRRYRKLLLEEGVIERGPRCAEYKGATWMRFVPAGGIPFRNGKCPPKVSVPVSLEKPSPVKTVSFFPSVEFRKCKSLFPAPSNTEESAMLGEGGEFSSTIAQRNGDGYRERSQAGTPVSSGVGEALSQAGRPLRYAVREGYGKRERDNLAQIWKAVLPEIRKRMDRHTFDCYVTAARLERLRDGILTLRVPSYRFVEALLPPPEKSGLREKVRVERFPKILEGARVILPRARGIKILSVDHSHEVPE